MSLESLKLISYKNKLDIIFYKTDTSNKKLICSKGYMRGIHSKSNKMKIMKLNPLNIIFYSIKSFLLNKKNKGEQATIILKNI
ncbi:MAG: hypothetical protein PHD05_06450 [Sphaerochaetaceae bacterium]|nr:hypothetical protein [Sphaerochaetaceae bacterium]